MIAALIDELFLRLTHAQEQMDEREFVRFARAAMLERLLHGLPK